MSKKFSRRQFGKLAGLSALGMAAAATPAEQPAGRATAHAPASFPKDFLWGTATSAYQIEGAVNEDGRGRSIWDTFAHTPGKIEDHTTADRANDHYHRYKEDVGLIKSLGVKAYRFSIAWPRIFPDGTGAPNPKGLDFYNRLIDELLAKGIEPYATLYHWDLPQALEDRVGGWRSSDTSKAFADYSGYVAERISDRVKNIFTLNEAGRFLNFGYGWGIDAPGLKLPTGELNQARHHVALAHGLAVQAIRAHGARRHQGRTCREHRSLRARVRHAGQCPRRRDGDARIERRPARRHAGGQIHRRLPRIFRQGRAEIHRRGTEDHRRQKRFRRPQHLRTAILHRGVRPEAGLEGAAVPGLVPAHEFGMAADRPGSDLLGAAAGGENLEHRQYLHQRERHLVGGQDRRRRPGLRSRSHHVPAQLSAGSCSARHPRACRCAAISCGA